MFIKYMDWLNKQKNLKIPHRAVVKDNDDPDKLGRIKVVIKDLLEGISIDNLPWIYPRNPYSLGGRVDLSTFSVPEIDSEVSVVFPYNNIYFGFYTGYWQSEITHQTLFDEDYPESYGKIDSTETWWKINKTQEYVEFRHVSETTIRIDKDGNIYIYNPGNVDWDIGKSLHLRVKEDFIIDVIKNYVKNVKEDEIKQIEGNLIEQIKLDAIKQIDGNKVDTVGQDVSMEAGQDYNLEAGNNVVIDVGVNYVKQVGNSEVKNIGNNQAAIVGNSSGIDASTMVTHNAAAVIHNGGVSLAGDVTSNIPSKIVDKQSSHDDSMDDHSDKMDVHTSKQDDLNTRIEELEQKVDELTQQADEIKQQADQIKQQLAQIT